MLVSIIMPVYNTGKILNKTIESILNQTFKDFELIIVDDDSNEETQLICEDFASKDNRIRFIKKENGGVCSARNLGINLAKGKYITFCDHDDCYDKQLLQTELNIIEGYDLAVVGKLTILDNGVKIKNGIDFVASNRIDVEKLTPKLLYNGSISCVWNILYKRNMIGDTRFNESLQKGNEDILFNLEILRKTNSIISTEQIMYYHYIRKSMSTSSIIHFEQVESSRIVNNSVYDLCNAIKDNINEIDYVNMQGSFLKVSSYFFCIFCSSYKDFKSYFYSLKFISINLKFFNSFKSKDAFIYYLFLKKKIHILHFICMIKAKRYKKINKQ